MYFVYILVCLQTGRSYVGQTDNLIRRFHLHQSGSTRTTREKLLLPVMVHWTEHHTRAEAVKQEHYFKSGSGHRVKREIIAFALNAFWPESTAIRD